MLTSTFDPTPCRQRISPFILGLFLSKEAVLSLDSNSLACNSDGTIDQGITTIATDAAQAARFICLKVHPLSEDGLAAMVCEPTDPTLPLFANQQIQRRDGLPTNGPIAARWPAGIDRLHQRMHQFRWQRRLRCGLIYVARRHTACAGFRLAFVMSHGLKKKRVADFEAISCISGSKNAVGCGCYAAQLRLGVNNLNRLRQTAPREARLQLDTRINKSTLSQPILCLKILGQLHPLQRRLTANYSHGQARDSHHWRWISCTKELPVPNDCSGVSWLRVCEYIIHAFSCCGFSKA